MQMKFEYVCTTFKEGVKEQEIIRTELVDVDEVENEVVNLYPQFRYQAFQGFGGAVTDSAGYVYSLLNSEQKKQVIHEYFDEDKLNYRLVRIPIDSCDFSLEHYEASSEENQKGFTLKRAGKYIFPMFEDIVRISGKIPQVMLSPWSPPAFMKTNGKRNGGGKLKKEYYEQWAQYICRYILEFQKIGIPVTALSIQNEPQAVQTWDSCIYTAQEEKEFLKDYLAPALRSHQIEVKIYIWDHNKERVLERTLALIDEETDSIITGIAVHWYSGDHFEALQMIREKFPQKEIILSEACIEYSKYEQGDCLENAKKYAHDLIGNIKHGLSAFYDWNMILDEKGGPNHVGNYCDAPYLFHTENGFLEKRNTLDYLWHFCHYIKPGSIRIGCSVYSEELEAVAFENGDEYTVIILNRTKENLPVNLRIGGKTTAFAMAPECILSGRISFNSKIW